MGNFNNLFLGVLSLIRDFFTNFTGLVLGILIGLLSADLHIMSLLRDLLSNLFSLLGSGISSFRG